MQPIKQTVNDQIYANFVLSDLASSYDDWYRLKDLAEHFNVSFNTVKDWADTKAVWSDYAHVVQDTGKTKIRHVHRVSWEQLCEDFWFRNVDGTVI